MSRKATGGFFESRGRFYARVTTAPGKRPAVLLSVCTTAKQAEARALLLGELVGLLRASDKSEYIATLLEQGATLPDARLPELKATVEGIASGARKPKAKPLPSVTTCASSGSSGRAARWPRRTPTT